MVTASERVIHLFTKKYMHACRNHRLTFPEDDFSVTKVYLNSIKIVQFAPQVIIDTSYVKWRDNEHFCCKTQIKYLSFRTCVKVSIICPLGKIDNLSNCQSWTITLHGGLLCLHNSKSKAGLH